MRAFVTLYQQIVKRSEANQEDDSASEPPAMKVEGQCGCANP
jgi:hypothetical protein